MKRQYRLVLGAARWRRQYLRRDNLFDGQRRSQVFFRLCLEIHPRFEWHRYQLHDLGSVEIYIGNTPTYNAAGNYEYFMITMVEEEVFSVIDAWFAPNTTTAQYQALVVTFFESWTNLAIKVNTTWTQLDSFLPARSSLTDAEAVGWTTVRSCLMPKENLLGPRKLNETHKALQNLLSRGSMTPWRGAAMQVIGALSWPNALSLSDVPGLSLEFTNEWLKPLRDMMEGAYASEADILDPKWQQAFFGSTYERLYDLKQQIGPTGLLYAHKAVGSEDWRITGQLEGLPTQNERLFRV